MNLGKVGSGIAPGVERQASYEFQEAAAAENGEQNGERKPRAAPAPAVDLEGEVLTFQISLQCEK